MAQFEIAVEKTLEWEGGYSNNPSDPGGETNFGISKRNHPEVDIRNLTVDGAKAIYRAQYWKSLYDQISSQLVGNKLFDMGVNLGVGTAVKILQQTLALPADGAFGPNTLFAVNRAGDAALAPYKQHLEGYYNGIVAARPDQAQFLHGWLRRVNS